uniref:KDEL motif-containing protein 1 n=1 Tax=Rhipicephalus zambeziensis TaxID=60191 RepID=A0A224Z0F2_9ACAR
MFPKSRMLLAGRLCVAVLLAAVVAAEEKCPVNACGESSWPNGRPQPQVSARLYGPGLRGDFNLPARYFFVHVLDASGNNFTAASSTNLSVSITGTSSHCSIWTQVLNRRDGLFIVRYKLFRSCPEAQVEVSFNGSPLTEAPVLIKGPLHHDACSCPVSFDKWLLQTKCPPVDPQILKDLAWFEEIDMKKMLREALRRFDRPGSVSFCHYAVIKNKVYRKCYGQHVGFNMFMDQILLSLARKVRLPDVEMLVNLGDWPLEQRSHTGVHIPFFFVVWLKKQHRYCHAHL